MALLRQLAHSADDPEYASQLARLLKEVGQLDDAQHWRAIAAARYDELMARHPEAFADHAAEFWLTIGGDAQKGHLPGGKESRAPQDATSVRTRATSRRNYPGDSGYLPCCRALTGCRSDGAASACAGRACLDHLSSPVTTSEGHE